MVDYSRFDHIDTDSDEDDAGRILSPSVTNPVNPGLGTVEKTGGGLVPTIASDKAPQLMTKKGKEGRFQFEHDGRTIYEWEQSLEEVNIYIEPPSGITRQMLDIHIAHTHLLVGLKGAPPFIDEDTGGPIKASESTWTLSDGEININMQKMNKAEAWDCALCGRAGEKIDAFTKEEVRKKLMLERFQEEVLICLRDDVLLVIISFFFFSTQLLTSLGLNSMELFLMLESSWGE